MERVHAGHSALLIVDVQNTFVHPDSLSVPSHAATIQIVSVAFGLVTTAREVMDAWVGRSSAVPG